MDTHLDSKRIVVTGASKGIGKRVAEELAKAGATVIAGARSFDDNLKQGFQTLPLDLESAQSIARFSSRALADGDVDVLVHCAGAGVFGKIEELTEAQWDQVFHLNVRGTFLLIKELVSSLKQRKGQVICVTSDVGSRPIAGGTIYASSKYAQRAILQCLQKELFDDGVRITEVSPGLVATQFAGNAQPPGHNFLDPQYVAKLIAFLIAQPNSVRVDNLTLHPVGQFPEF